MAKNYYEGTDYNINTNWGGDESTGGLPLPGSAVQDIIKEELKTLDKGKVGYVHENGGVLYFASSENDFNDGKYIVEPIKAGDPRYILSAKKGKNNKTAFLSYETEKKFVWYFKTDDRLDDNIFDEIVTVKYAITNKTKNNKYKEHNITIVPNPDVNNDNYTEVVLNLDDYLEDGLSDIEITITGAKTKQETVLSESITIVVFSLEDTTKFYHPFYENITINADVTCTDGNNFKLEYRFDDEENFETYDFKYEGTGKSNSISPVIDIRSMEVGRHVCEYRLFIILDSVYHYTDIQRIEFIVGGENDDVNKELFKDNEPFVLIFSTYEENDKIIAEDGNLIINNVIQYNTYALKYAVYHPSNTNIIVKFKNGSYVTTDNVSTIVAKHEFQFIEPGITSIEINTEDSEGVSLNTEKRIVYLNVINSNLNISIKKEGLRVDFSSIGKTNDSNKTTWISNVTGEANYTNEASFNDEFDWSQGWTQNGLVIGDNSKVTFDYVPFPYSETSNQYVVGGNNAYTLELEFMTQNVTNEDAVVCNMIDVLTGCGLLITGSEFKFIINKTLLIETKVSTRFKANELNRIALVIRPYYYYNEKNERIFKGLVELYVNGVLSNIEKYTEDKIFYVQGYSNENDTTSSIIDKKLSFEGKEGANIVIKYIRITNNALSDDEILNNYILYRTDSREMVSLYNKNNILNDANVITPESVIAQGKVPVLIFYGRTVENGFASGDGNNGDGEGNCDEDYKEGDTSFNTKDWYETLELTTNKKLPVNMDVVYVDPEHPSKNFKFIKAYVTPQGTSSMYYPKKNYRIYTQKNDDTRCFFSDMSKNGPGVLTFDEMKKWNFGENNDDRKWERWRGKNNKSFRKYAFKDNSQPVNCWCLKADFAETSSSHNTGIARLWGDTLKNATVKIGDSTDEIRVFETNAQRAIREMGKTIDVRTTIDGFPIVVFGAKSYNAPVTFLGQYNFNNDKSTESVFGFCNIDKEEKLSDKAWDYESNAQVEDKVHTLDDMLNKYMTCVETLDNGNILANFGSMESEEKIPWDKSWDNAFEFRYPEIPEPPKPKNYANGEQDEKYISDLAEYTNIELPNWENKHLKPFKHFAQWIFDTRWCDVNGEILIEELQTILDEAKNKDIDILDESGNTIINVEELASFRKRKFASEKWDHLDVWKVAAYYVYVMRFGAVDQTVKNSMLTSEGPFAIGKGGSKVGYWDATDITSKNYGKYLKWYFINYDNDTIMGVKNDGSLAYGPEINRKSVEGVNNFPIYAGYNSTLWNNLDNDSEFQLIVEKVDQGISNTMTYNKAIEMFDVEQVGKWCERIYNKDAEYKYVGPYKNDWVYKNDEDKEAEKEAGVFADKLFMLQGARTAHRHWWLSRRFSLYDGKWGAGDFFTKYIEVKCDFGSINDKFGAVAGSNAFFGYKINGITFGAGAPDGGTITEYPANTQIDWKLYKNVQIGDPIALYGANDILELNLQGLSKGLKSLMFQFGNNVDIENKLERLILSIPDDSLLNDFSYKPFNNLNDLLKEYPEITKDYFTEDKLSDVEIVASPDSPEFYYRRFDVIDKETLEVTGETYVYFAKVENGDRNSSCTSLGLTNLTKLQELKIAGYIGLGELDFTNNKFLTILDARYTYLNNLTFKESRISELKISDTLSVLNIISCDNLNITNITVNSTTLSNNRGIYLQKINIENSSKLLKDSINFKPFIIKWMKGGDDFISTNKRELTLNGIEWEGVDINDIKIMLNFIKKCHSCKIIGSISMGNINLSNDDMNIINEFTEMTSVSIKFPYPTIIIQIPETIIANNKGVELTSRIFGGTSDNYDVRYTFVKEVESDGSLIDTNKGKQYIELDKERYDTTSIIKENGKFYIKAEEKVVNEDTPILIAAIIDGTEPLKFDVKSLIIKDPTYPIKATIIGEKNINKINTEYKFESSIISNKGDEPIGTFKITWELSGEGLNYIATSGVSEDSKILSIKTDSKLPDEESLLAELFIKLNIENTVNKDYSNIDINNKVYILNKNVILTDATNPIVMGICSGQNWTSKNNVLTISEAEKIEDIGTCFSVTTTEEWSFDEFRYFTKVKNIPDEAFKDSKITSIIFPDSVEGLGASVFENCTLLKNVTLNDKFTELPSKTFLNCVSLENLILPNSINIISANVFGGVGMKYILFENNKNNSNKTIFISKNSNLKIIKNNAFEKTSWNYEIDNKNKIVSIKTTNILKEISIPNNLTIDNTKYNFLLSPELEKITIDENDNLIFENNILFNKNRNIVYRAVANSNNFIEDVKLSDCGYVYPYAFYNCNNIKKITFGDKVEKYGLSEGAFFNSTIEEIDLSKSKNLRKLNKFTFYDAQKLEIICLPQDGHLSELGEYLFKGCPLSNGIELPNTIQNINSNGQQFYNCGFEVFELPEGILTLPEYFITDCNNLTALTFNKFFKIESAGSSTISRIPNLKTVKLPFYSFYASPKMCFIYEVKDGNRFIKYSYDVKSDAEDMKTRLENINADNENKHYYEIIEIDKGTNIVVNNNLFVKGKNEFFELCNNIENYYLQDLDNGLIFKTDEDGNIYRTGIMQNGEIISTSGNMLAKVINTISAYTLPNSYTIIEDGCFANNKIISEINLHNNIIEIGKEAFAYCSSIKSIKLESEIKTINNGMFYDCSSLQEVIIPDTVEKIGNNSFEKCVSLKNIDLPNSLTSIGESAFREMAGLLELNIPEKVTIIPREMCYKCFKLKTVKILSSYFSEIGIQAFAYCTQLDMLLINTLNAPKLFSGYLSHPFGWSDESYTGFNSKDNNILYIPKGASGYTENGWEVLLDETKCGFKKEDITLKNDIEVVDENLNNMDIVYVKREINDTETILGSSNIISNTTGTIEPLPVLSPYNEGESKRIVMLNSEKIYHGETIVVYSDEECNNEIGRFIAKYGVNVYELTKEIVMGSTYSKSLFNTNIFEDEQIVENDNLNEIANITKHEYNLLLAKVNQLMKLLNKKK